MVSMSGEIPKLMVICYRYGKHRADEERLVREWLHVTPRTEIQDIPSVLVALVLVRYPPCHQQLHPAFIVHAFLSSLIQVMDRARRVYCISQ